MLSSYFKNFRYTEDFKKSGKVYIKDTASTKTSSAVTTQTSNEPVTSTTTSVLMSSNVEKNVLQQAEMKSSDRMQQQQQQQLNNYNPLNLANLKNVIQNVPKHVVTEALGNLTVNTAAAAANNEIINIAQLVDLDTLVSQTNVANKKAKPRKIQENNSSIVKMQESSGVIKIQMGTAAAAAAQNDLDSSDFDLKLLDRLPHIKGSPLQNKFAYSIKIDESKSVNTTNQTVLINQLSADQSNQMLYETQQTTNSVVNMPSAAAAAAAAAMNSVTQIVNQQTHTTTTNPIHSTTANFQQVIETNTRNSFITTKHYIETTNNITTTTNNNDEFIIKQQQPPQVIQKEQQQQQQQQNFTATLQQLNKSHSCDICRKTFKRREHLYQHIKLHTGFRPFTCECCNKAFMRKEHLLRHMTSHSGQKNFTCNICEKSFSRNDNLLKHKKTHDKQTSFTCEICQKQFVMKHYYVAHKMTHETDNNKCAAAAIHANGSWGLLKV